MKKKYPYKPGFKEPTTSREAAERIEQRAPNLRQMTFACIIANPGLRADELADKMGKSPWSIRPRVTELRKMGKIVHIGRGKNPSGASAMRWQVAPDADVEEAV